MRIVDAWMQHPSAALLRHSMFSTLRRWDAGTEVAGDPSIEDTLQAMDEGGVTVGLLCAWWAPNGPLISNDEVAAFVRLHPRRFVGIASVDLCSPMAAVRELRRCVRQHGFKGLRIVPWIWHLPPDDRRYYPLYAECVELGIPFCTQVGHTGPLHPSEPGRPIPYLDHVALEFPELRIVGGHIGFPWTNEMIALATKYPNVYIDTSAYTVKRYPTELVDFMRHHGTQKVLFGSNHPFWPPAQCLADIAKLDLSQEALENFLHVNAERVFDL